MVTIEQKLSMFNKLLQRSMDDNFAAEIEYLRKDHSTKRQQVKSDIDREVKSIEEKAYKRAEKEKTKIFNQASVAQRMEYMSAKEELFSIMLEKLKFRVNEFIQSKDYKSYLIFLAKQLAHSERASESISIFMTRQDVEKYGNDVKLVLRDLCKGSPNIEIGDDTMIGGLVFMNSDFNIRVDLSIKTLLDESKSMMMQTFFQALLPGQNEEEQVE